MEARRRGLYLRNRRHSNGSLDRSPRYNRRRSVLNDNGKRDSSTKVKIMSDQDLSTRSNHALWMAIGIMLAPLVPYALSGTGG